MASVCSLCFKHTENSNHLFLNCIYATSLWSWFSNFFSITLDNSSVISLLRSCSNHSNKQLVQVLIACLVHTLSKIWFCRNQKIFENDSTPLHLAINAIKRDTSLSGASAKASSSAHTVQDLITLRSLDIALNFNRAPVIIEVIWRTPRVGWVKANSDGTAHGSPGHSGSGGLFRDHKGSFMLAFSNYTNIQSALFAELHGAMHAVAIAANPASFVVEVQEGYSLLQFSYITYIYREGNQCADRLANHGLHSRTNLIWSTIPNFIVNDCNRNALSLPNYRFKND
ncbi:PREDICTED: uncharacterized protein LOC109335415 [Lupinus angustifolius]|uniref:uncharacterized protein LOC109335415 n=1 Tax=Lupinus angustifolius TaxID=3871 RepID=UPI00092EF64E|nr:PREDICTED: uncharacterized protein LOC109335415 [Lupinus angustifolius]